MTQRARCVRNAYAYGLPLNESCGFAAPFNRDPLGRAFGATLHTVFAINAERHSGIVSRIQARQRFKIAPQRVVVKRAFLKTPQPRVSPLASYCH